VIGLVKGNCPWDAGTDGIIADGVGFGADARGTIADGVGGIIADGVGGTIADGGVIGVGTLTRSTRVASERKTRDTQTQTQKAKSSVSMSMSISISMSMNKITSSILHDRETIGIDAVYLAIGILNFALNFDGTNQCHLLKEILGGRWCISHPVIEATGETKLLQHVTSNRCL
jgi:hypothetical protein